MPNVIERKKRKKRKQSVLGSRLRQQKPKGLDKRRQKLNS